MEQFIITILETYGIPTAILAAAVYITYKTILPAVIAQWKELNEKGEEYQRFLLEEIKRLRVESAEDKKVTQELVRQNTEAFHLLQRTQELFKNELVEVRKDLAQVKDDVSEVFKIVGERKNLISRGKPND